MVMNKLIERNLLTWIKLSPLQEMVFLSSIVAMAFNKNGPIRIHYFRVQLLGLTRVEAESFCRVKLYLLNLR